MSISTTDNIETQHEASVHTEGSCQPELPSNHQELEQHIHNTDGSNTPVIPGKYPLFVKDAFPADPSILSKSTGCMHDINEPTSDNLFSNTPSSSVLHDTDISRFSPDQPSNSNDIICASSSSPTKVSSPSRNPLKRLTPGPQHLDKRRRLDEVRKTLQKPFRSPLAMTSGENRQGVDIHMKNPELYALPCQRVTPRGKRPSNLFKSPLASKTEDTEVNSLQNRIKELEKKTNQTRKDIEMTKTARSYELKNEDSRLVELIQKWKNVSQQAADEIYATVSKRVNAAGGIAGLGRSAFQESWGWAEDEKPSAHVSGNAFEPPPTTAAEPKHRYTMEMMLEQLNIPFETIGWSINAGFWE